MPPWLRLIPYRLPPAEVLMRQTVLVFEVTPEQSPPVAAAHLVDYLLEMGELGPAAARQLEQYPFDLRAQVTLACYQGQTGQTEAFAATLERVRDDLPQAAALAVEDRIRLALVLAADRQTELARAQLRQVEAQLDERTLRRLTTGTLRDLLRLTETLGVELSDSRLRQLALSLYPPMLRRSS